MGSTPAGRSSSENAVLLGKAVELLPLFELALVFMRFDYVAGRCNFIRLVCGFGDGADVANPQISAPAKSDWPGNGGPSGQLLPPARSRERSSTLPLHDRLRPSR